MKWGKTSTASHQQCIFWLFFSEENGRLIYCVCAFKGFEKPSVWSEEIDRRPDSSHALTGSFLYFSHHFPALLSLLSITFRLFWVFFHQLLHPLRGCLYFFVSHACFAVFFVRSRSVDHNQYFFLLRQNLILSEDQVATARMWICGIVNDQMLSWMDRRCILLVWKSLERYLAVTLSWMEGRWKFVGVKRLLGALYSDALAIRRFSSWVHHEWNLFTPGMMQLLLIH